MKTILVDAYNTFVTNEGINMEMHVMLERFPNNKVILTNADKEKQGELGLVNLPYKMFTQDFNPLKHSPLYYENFLNELNLKPENCLYFEHDEKAVESARSVGIKTLHYDQNEKDIFEIEKFIKDNI